MSLIFSTPHGSVLYGLNHAGSDRDMMYVHDDHRRARQRVVDGEDYVNVGLGDFLAKATGGAHQYLEALFSPMKIYHNSSYRPMLESYRVPAGWIRGKYMRTIRHFSYGDTLKRRRHALRLALALNHMAIDGRFNPQLDPRVAHRITKLAEEFSGDGLYSIALSMIDCDA